MKPGTAQQKSNSLISLQGLPCLVHHLLMLCLCLVLPPQLQGDALWAPARKRTCGHRQPECKLRFMSCRISSVRCLVRRLLEMLPFKNVGDFLHLFIREQLHGRRKHLGLQLVFLFFFYLKRNWVTGSQESRRWILMSICRDMENLLFL